MFSRIRIALLTLFRRKRSEADLDEEFSYHLARATEQNIARGMTADEARRSALVGFGGLEKMKEESRNARGLRLLQDLFNDIHYGARVLLRSPGFTAVVVIMLALGVGANAAVFGLIDKLLLRSLPVKDPGSLVVIEAESVNPHFLNNIFSYPDYRDYQNQNDVFTGTIAHSDAACTLNRGDNSRNVQVSFISSNYFQVLGVDVRGRAFLPQETQTEGSSPIAVISYGLWAALGSDPAIIGKSVTVNDVTLKVIGITPKAFTGVDLERPVEVWAPMMMYHSLIPDEDQLMSRRVAWLSLMGRLKNGVSLTQARAGLDVVAQQVFVANTSVADRSLPFNEKHIILVPGGKGSSVLRKTLSSALKLMSVVAALLLIIACANVAGLLLARAETQRKEIAVRLALGATRGRLVRMLLVQSGLLAVGGAVLGFTMAPWLYNTVLAYQPGVDIEGTVFQSHLDLRVVGFGIAIAAVSSLLFGLAPALKSSRANLVPELKGEKYAAGRRQLNPRTLLVTGQIALAVVILIGAGLLVRSLRNLLAIDPGFKPDNVAVLALDLDHKMSEEAMIAFHSSLFDRVKALPGVSSVSTSKILPLTGAIGSRSVIVEGYQQTAGMNLSVSYNVVGSGYHSLMGIPVLHGREFTPQDRKGAPPVAIVNEAFSRAFFADADPVGKRIRLGTNTPWVEIVGESRDVKSIALTEATKPSIDLPVLQQSYGPGHWESLLVKAQNNPALAGAAVRDAVKELDPAAKIESVRTMEEILMDSIASTRMASTLTVLFGAIALLLAGIGLYGIMAYSVNQRRHEIGIRMALGASVPRVVGNIVIKGAIPVLAGVSIGIVAAVLTTRVMKSLLYGVAPTDAVSFLAAGVVLVITGLFACYVPARRSAKADPMSSLRCD